MTRSPLRVLILAVTAALGAVLLAPSATATAAAPSCGVTWGSMAKSASTPTRSLVLDVRAGRHACYDRLVIDLGGRSLRFGSYDVRYVPLVRADGSGAAVPVRGAADLQITLRAPAYDERGNATFAPANRREVVSAAGYRTFRQVAWAGSFEGQTTLALGVRARLPFRVSTLPALPGSEMGPRLVIDVAHAW